MPRFAQAAPDSDSRKALEERARAVASPSAPEEKGRWPFPVAQTPSPSESPTTRAGAAETQPAPPK